MLENLPKLSVEGITAREFEPVFAGMVHNYSGHVQEA